MIQPVMIPILQTHFPTHMAQQLRPVPQQHQQPYPMDSLRPPMPPQVQQPEENNQLPPNQVLHQIAQEIIAQRIMEAQRAREEQQNQEMRSNPEQMQKLPIPEEVLSQLNRLPNRDVIITVSQEFDDAQEPQGQVEQMRGVKALPQEMNAPQQMMVQVPEMRQDTQSTPNEMSIMPAVAPEASQEMKVFPQQRQAEEMNGRQVYGRALPIHIPVHMVQQGQAEPRAAASEDSRPHCMYHLFSIQNHNSAIVDKFIYLLVNMKCQLILLLLAVNKKFDYGPHFVYYQSNILPKKSFIFF